MVWLTIAVLTAAFYLIEHAKNTQISRLESFSVTRDEMVASVAEGDTGRRLAIFTIGLFGTLLHLRRDGRRPELRSRLGWLLLSYCAWCGLSILWSDHPLLTLRHLSVLLFCGVGALGIARQASLRDLCLITVAVSMVLMLNGVFTEIVLGTFRPFSAEYRFAGTLHPNAQANYCTIMALAAACLALCADHRRILFWMPCLIGVIFVVLTKSRTCCGALVVALLICGLLTVPLPKKIMAVAGIFSVVSALLLASVLLDWDLKERVIDVALIGRKESADSLTGRVPLWEELVPHVQEHFLLGRGYQTFWTPERIESMSRLFYWAVPSGHCAYLDMFLELGAIGAALCVATIVTCIGIARRRFLSGGDYGFGFLLVLLVFHSLSGILESKLTEPTSFPTFIMMCGLAHLGFCRGPDPGRLGDSTQCATMGQSRFTSPAEERQGGNNGSTPEADDMFVPKAAEVHEHFVEFADRRHGDAAYPLINVAVIAVCAVICGADDFVAIAEFGRKRRQWFARFLDLHNCIPADTCFHAIVAAIKPTEFATCFLGWVTALRDIAPGQVATRDETSLRRNFDAVSGKTAMHGISTWATAHQISLGQVVGAKSDEITATAKLLQLLEVSGSLVTMDGMGCQAEIARRIIEGKADYVLPVKGNQPTLQQGIKDFFDDHLEDDFARAKVRRFETEGKEHGRKETRHYCICPVPDDLPDRSRWAGLAAIGIAFNEIQRDGLVCNEVRYYIFSKFLTGRCFAEAVHGHWEIENDLHWQLDLTFQADQGRMRKSHVETNFSTLRRIALTMLQNESSLKVSVKNKRLAAGWDEAYLEKVLLGQ